MHSWITRCVVHAVPLTHRLTLLCAQTVRVMPRSIRLGPFWRWEQGSVISSSSARLMTVMTVIARMSPWARMLPLAQHLRHHGTLCRYGAQAMSSRWPTKVVLAVAVAELPPMLMLV